MEPLDSWLVFIVGTILSTYFVAFAYKKTKFVLKHKVAMKREEAVTKEMTKKLAEDKKMQKNEKDHR
jgi:translocon-associated protein subunit gamma